MENEDKRPEVWVARRLMRRGCGCEPYTIAYFASKARVQTVTRRFLRNGQEVKEYQVEYETPVAIEELGYDSDIYAETGDWVKVGHQAFKNYTNINTYVDLLNERVETAKISNVPNSMIDETLENIREEIAFARRLEKYFDKTTQLDSRDDIKLF